jgi:hypothetical protein
MSIIVEASPDREELFGESAESVSTPETEMAEKLQSAYQQRFAYYERELAAALDLLDAVSPGLASSSFPEISVLFDGEQEEVIFDFSLYERLLEIYIFEGWAGILSVEEALDVRLPQADEDAPSAGTPVNARTLWLPVKNFFRFTRNLLALLIRETLGQIERKAAASITADLSASAWRIANAWNSEFQIKESYKSEYVPFSEGKFVKREIYRFGNRSLSDALFVALSEAVRQKFAYEETLRREARFREDIETIRGYLGRTRARARPHERQRLDQDLSQLEMKQEEVRQLTKQSEALLKSALSVIHTNSPLGLVVLDGLNVGFTQEEMEQKLGVALRGLSEKIDEIGRAVDPGFSRVAVRIPTVDADELIPWDAIQRREPPPECLSLGIETYIVASAVEGLAADPGWFPLAHEATWHRLVESGVVAKDSFEYVVYAHYVSALIDRVEDEREAFEASETFWKAFGRIAGALSLASLATPATAEFAPLLRGVSAVTDLAVMANTIYSVTGNLARLNRVLAEVLIHPDAFALEHLARIGELVQIRREVLDQIALQFVLELALMGAGARWAAVKKLTLARGYYSDLETLLGDGD